MGRTACKKGKYMNYEMPELTIVSIGEDVVTTSKTPPASGGGFETNALSLGEELFGGN